MAPLNGDQPSGGQRPPLGPPPPVGGLPSKADGVEEPKVPWSKIFYKKLIKF
jgi:hypothetical protein